MFGSSLSQFRVVAEIRPDYPSWTNLKLFKDHFSINFGKQMFLKTDHKKSLFVDIFLQFKNGKKQIALLACGCLIAPD